MQFIYRNFRSINLYIIVKINVIVNSTSSENNNIIIMLVDTNIILLVVHLFLAKKDTIFKVL